MPLENGKCSLGTGPAIAKMGRLAHSSTAHHLDIIGAPVQPDHLELVQRIRALLSASAEGAGFPRQEVEPTLTEGYARALELEGECLRLECRIERLTRLVAEGREIPAEKLSELLRRLTETEQETQDLRALLVPLREVVATAA
jgi:hypothetical protein